MRIIFPILSVFITIAGAAPPQIATVSSPAEFQLRDAQIKPGQGVPSWPALDGDKITAGNSPVLFTFGNGSTILLAPHSEASVGMAGERPVFRLLCGSANYSLKTIAAITLMAHDKVVVPSQVQGSYKVDGGCDVGGGWWTGPKTLLVLGGVAALAYGIVEATQGGSPVSPSR